MRARVEKVDVLGWKKSICVQKTYSLLMVIKNYIPNYKYFVSKEIWYLSSIRFFSNVSIKCFCITFLEVKMENIQQKNYLHIESIHSQENTSIGATVTYRTTELIWEYPTATMISVGQFCWNNDVSGIIVFIVRDKILW